jgi:ATP-dependent DNA helicase RecQ
MEAHLNELSTYGLLKDMRQDDILVFIDALLSAGCLHVSPGAYPTVSVTELGNRVMREREQIELAIPLRQAKSNAQTRSQVSGN